MAGILGAAKNGIGMHGVAYNSNLVIARHIGATSYEEWFNALSQSVDYTTDVACGATILNNSYSESGAGKLSQIADPFSNTYSTGEIGLEMARQIPKGRYAFRIGYKRALGGIDPDLTIAYSGAPGSKLTIKGSEQDKQQLTFGLSIQGEMAKDWTIDSQLNHQQGAISRSLTAVVTLRKVW